MSPVTVTTTTTPVMVVCSREETHHYNCYNDPDLCGLSSIWSVGCASGTTVDPDGHNDRFCCPLHCATAATTSAQMLSKAYANHTMGPPQVSFLFQSCEPPTDELCMYVGACYGVCFLLSGSHMDAMLTNEGSNFKFAMPQPYEVYPYQAYVPPAGGL